MTIIEAEGLQTRLKWHSLRDHAQRPAHARDALRLGLENDALLEIDIQPTADDHWVCLHDTDLDRETTGSGPIRQSNRAQIETVRQRDNQGSTLTEAPLFLDEVVAMVARAPFGRMQLDLKADKEALSARAIDRFVEAIGQHGDRFDLGGHNWTQVHALSLAVPDIEPGYDPCDIVLAQGAGRPHDWLDIACHKAAQARTLYLHQGLVMAGYLAGQDIPDVLKKRGIAMDCWTMEPWQPTTMELLGRLVASGCRQVTTNDPLRMQALWQQRMSTPEPSTSP